MRVFVCSAALVLLSLSLTAKADKTVIPTTLKTVEGACGEGHQPCTKSCGSTTCDYRCDLTSGCTVTVKNVRHKSTKPTVTDVPPAAK
jgi:hypothetical protein